MGEFVDVDVEVDVDDYVYVNVYVYVIVNVHVDVIGYENANGPAFTVGPLRHAVAKWRYCALPSAFSKFAFSVL